MIITDLWLCRHMSDIQCRFQLKSVHKYKYSMPIAMSFGLVYFRKISLRISSRYLFIFPLSPTSSSFDLTQQEECRGPSQAVKGHTHDQHSQNVQSFAYISNCLWNCPNDIYFRKRSFFNLNIIFSSKFLVSGRYKIIF